MGRYPWFRRRRFFIRKGPQGRFVVGMAVVVTLGLLINIIAAYFLIDNRLAARLYKIHLQASSTLDIIWPVIWKLTLGSAFFVVLAGVALGYYLTRRLDIVLVSYLDVMKRAGQDKDLTVRVRTSSHDLSDAGSAFNRAIMFFDERLGKAKVAATEIETSMKEINRLMGAQEEPLRREELIAELNHMMSRSNEALNDISIFRV